MPALSYWLCCLSARKSSAVQETKLNILRVCAGMAHAGSSSQRRCQMSAVTEQQA